MEINEEQPMRTSKGYLFTVRASATVPFTLAKAGREVRKFCGKEKGRFQECPDGGCWQEKNVSVLTRNGHPV